ncbi:uncharacterized protein Aud_009912 [Aspergillus udagawae]|uniref:Uncharacterized protein n=1 Tax=Aspergillus udagawae TaxID=91492 RepID=A0A8E0QZR1_9EURO|nr:uncharacterized protein Aud_009912 [Aspergillus udagawae]GIC93425.1 hypothetical protein Aud_009912 [Aspergillus udagawae]
MQEQGQKHGKTEWQDTNLYSDTKELQGIVGVRRPLKVEKEEEEEGEEKEEEVREYPSLLRRDIANNDRQNNLVKDGKRGKRENGSKKTVVQEQEQ